MHFDDVRNLEQSIDSTKALVEILADRNLEMLLTVAHSVKFLLQVQRETLAVQKEKDAKYGEILRKIDKVLAEYERTKPDADAEPWRASLEDDE